MCKTLANAFCQAPLERSSALGFLDQSASPSAAKKPESDRCTPLFYTTEEDSEEMQDAVASLACFLQKSGGMLRFYQDLMYVAFSQ